MTVYKFFKDNVTYLLLVIKQKATDWNSYLHSRVVTTILQREMNLKPDAPANVNDDSWHIKKSKKS